jgi:hypothetical protein
MLIAAIGVRTVSHSLTDLTEARMFADRKMTARAPAASSILIDRRLTIGGFRRCKLAGEPLVEIVVGRPLRCAASVIGPEFLK